jgi:hypothetical protein
MMNRGNMGKEISTAPKSKKVKKMMMGGMADGARRPAVMPPRPGGPGMGRPGIPPSMGPGGMPRPPAGGPGMGLGGNMGPGGMTRAAPGTPQAGMMAAAAEAMRNRQAMGMKKGGAVKGYAKGGIASRGDGCCMKGKTKGSMR